MLVDVDIRAGGEMEKVGILSNTCWFIASEGYGRL
jgi:hypothetical protein